MAPIVKHADTAPRTKRPNKYWEPLNSWWRAVFNAMKRRPRVAEMRKWHAQNVHLWAQEAPSFKEMLKHAKGLRTIDGVKNYFRKYRKAIKVKANKGPEGQQAGPLKRACADSPTPPGAIRVGCKASPAEHVGGLGSGVEHGGGHCIGVFTAAVLEAAEAPWLLEVPPNAVEDAVAAAVAAVAAAEATVIAAIPPEQLQQLEEQLQPLQSQFSVVDLLAAGAGGVDVAQTCAMYQSWAEAVRPHLQQQQQQDFLQRQQQQQPAMVPAAGARRVLRARRSGHTSGGGGSGAAAGGAWGQMEVQPKGWQLSYGEPMVSYGSAPLPQQHQWQGQQPAAADYRSGMPCPPPLRTAHTWGGHPSPPAAELRHKQPHGLAGWYGGAPSAWEQQQQQQQYQVYGPYDAAVAVASASAPRHLQQPLLPPSHAHLHCSLPPALAYDMSMQYQQRPRGSHYAGNAPVMADAHQQQRQQQQRQQQQQWHQQQEAQQQQHQQVLELHHNQQQQHQQQQQQQEWWTVAHSASEQTQALRQQQSASCGGHGGPALAAPACGGSNGGAPDGAVCVVLTPGKPAAAAWGSSGRKLASFQVFQEEALPPTFELLDHFPELLRPDSPASVFGSGLGLDDSDDGADLAAWLLE